MTQIIAVDLGGTNVRAAYFPTPEPPPKKQEKIATQAHEGVDAVLDRIAQLVRSQIPDGVEDIRVGIGAPGPLDPTTGIVMRAPNLPGWEQIPLRDELSRRLGCPIIAGNDANVAAIGEWKFGAGRGTQHMIYLTVSTGIGGGVISHGQLLLGAHGMGGELGHVTIDPSRAKCGCGQLGHIEAVASGPAMARRANRALEEGTSSSLRSLYEETGSVTAKDIGTAAKEGDELSLTIVGDSASLIGHYLADLAHIFNPEVFVIGGGVSQIGDMFFEQIRKSLRSHVMNEMFLDGLRVEPAALGDDAGLIGAMALASMD